VVAGNHDSNIERLEQTQQGMGAYQELLLTIQLGDLVLRQ
jgi:hypothetical protein